MPRGKKKVKPQVEVKEEVKETEVEETKNEETPVNQRKIPEGMKVSDEDITVPNTFKIPTEWVKVTQEQVDQAQKDGKLYGFDDKNMTALIRE